MNMVHPQVISNVSWLQTSTNHFSSFLVDLGMVYYWAYYMSPSIFHHLGTSGGIAGHTNIIIVNNNYREFSYHTLSHQWGCHPTYIEGELLVQRRVITEGCQDACIQSIANGQMGHVSPIQFISLVVCTSAYVVHILGMRIPTDSYVSKGLKPFPL